MEYRREVTPEAARVALARSTRSRTLCPDAQRRRLRGRAARAGKEKGTGSTATHDAFGAQKMEE